MTMTYRFAYRASKSLVTIVFSIDQRYAIYDWQIRLNNNTPNF